jgi:hypothetical protein
MPETGQSDLQQRVRQAAEAVLDRSGSVGPLELFQELGWLHSVHVDAWRRGIEHYHVLEKWIRAGPGKIATCGRSRLPTRGTVRAVSSNSR